MSDWGMIHWSNIDWSTAVTWVFSGIGVALLGWFGKWLYKRYSDAEKARGIPSENESSQVNISGSNIEGPVAGRDVNIGTYIQNATAPAGSDPHDEYHETPTPSDIAAAIEKASLYLRESVANSYVGIKVRWRAKLYNVHPRGSGEIDVSFRTRRTDPYVVATVLIEEYPILKTMRGGEPIEITGMIKHVQINAMIYLADVKLKFLPETDS